jgi:hypothetical protein
MSKRSFIVITSDEQPTLLKQDVDPIFDVITYSYRGMTKRRGPGAISAQLDHFIYQTSGLGESLHYLGSLDILSYYSDVIFINGDVDITFHQINSWIATIIRYNLLWSQPSLSLDSSWSHPWTLNQSSALCRVNFVESMVFSIPSHVLTDYSRTRLLSYSSWGLDKYLFPYLYSCRKGSFLEGWVDHSCIVKHARPIQSSKVIYPNGLTAYEELALVRKQLSMGLLTF